MTKDIHEALQILIRAERARSCAVDRKPVITVSHDYGSGGRELARKLAKALDVPFYDQALLNAIAQSSGIDSDLLAQLDEQAKLHWTQWLIGFKSLHRQEQVQFYQHLVNLCLNILQSGGVIVGRGAHIILANHPVFRLRVVGSLEHCATRIANREQIDFAAARIKAEKANQDKRQFVWDYFRRELDDPRAFDLVLNSDRLDIERQFPLLVEVVRAFDARYR
ncbi:MAG: cytidylate kinase-like family protein [Chitinivorax sp.]